MKKIIEHNTISVLNLSNNYLTSFILNLLLFLFLCLNLPVSAQSFIPVVGVIKTSCNGMSFSVCNGADGKIIQLLESSGRFHLIDRSKMSQVLKELKTQQQLGLPEISRLGTLLSAEKILSTSINRVSGISLVTTEEDFQLNVSVVNVATGKVEFTLSESFKGYAGVNPTVEKSINSFLLNTEILLKVISLNNESATLSAEGKHTLEKGTQYSARCAGLISGGRFENSIEEVVCAQVKIISIRNNTITAEVLEGKLKPNQVLGLKKTD